MAEKKQKWPLFGERLIDGDINKQIYEYVGLNHRYNGLCLLGLIFPNDYNLEKEEEQKEEDKDDNNDADNDDDNDDDDDNGRDNKKINVNISNEIKKDIILKILYNCFGEKRNYSLFKYIYLTPARSLVYKNLYEEMKHFVQEEDKDINFESIEENAKKYIKNIEKEINEVIQKANSNNSDDSDSEEINSPPPIEEFKCLDINLKKFIGFNSDIIPGQIIREEIVQLAQTKKLAMYSIQYFTKYFKTEELRNILLHKNDGNNEETEKKEE